MAKGAYIGVNGVARKVKKVYVGVNGVAREVKTAYVGIANLARQWLNSYRMVFSTTKSTHSSFSATTLFAGVDENAWRLTINYSLSSYIMGSSRAKASVNIYGDDIPLQGKTLGISGIVYAPDSYSVAEVAFIDANGTTISTKSYKGSASGTSVTDTLTVPDGTQTILICMAAGSPGSNKIAELVLNSVTLDGTELI